ncbi:hypothetical protein IJ843_07435 [bacterium]|nr:hypothetical protein [bacterium]
MNTNEQTKIERKQRIKEIKKQIKKENKKHVNYKTIAFIILFSIACGLVNIKAENFIENISYIEQIFFK